MLLDLQGVGIVVLRSSFSNGNVVEYYSESSQGDKSGQDQTRELNLQN